MGTWEHCMRKLVRAKPQVFVDLMVEQLEVERQVRYIEEYPRSEKLTDSSFEVDTLLDVVVDEQEPSLIHFEWQAYYASAMLERLLRYSVLVRCELDSAVLSCVWHMLSDTRIKPSPLLWTEPITGKVVEYRYVVIEMGDFVAEDLFSRGEVVLLPFVPLAKGGATRASVQRMLEALSGEGCEELAYVGFTLGPFREQVDQDPITGSAQRMITLFVEGPLARSVFTKAHNEADYAWLIERYGTMNSMIHDLLDEDPVYLSIKEKGLQEGRQEGRQQGLQQAAITLVVASFPDLEALATAKISAIGDVERLRQLVIALNHAKTRKQIERVLLSLGE
jgi:hypothetical protein